VPEGAETSMFNLLPGDDYIIDSDNDSFSLTITDGPADIPEIGFSIEPDMVAEGDRATILFELSAPAPAGGLEVNWMELDPDGAGDGQLVLEESTNIADVRGLVEDDQPVGVVVTVAEGATEAELVLEFDQDGVPEGAETSMLLP